MNSASESKISKWPFIAAWIVLLAAAFVVAVKAPGPISQMEIVVAVACVALGALLGCLPFILDYRATGKLIEVNAVGAVADQLLDLKNFSAQISAATEQWVRVQDATKANTDKTVIAAKEIADRMVEEIRDFNEFQQKLNDTEKGALRLEVEKLRRSEGEWLQIVARILDHIFALHAAAVRSGNADFAEQIGNFQNACRDTARRVGLVQFEAAPDEKFDAQKHRAHGVENPPADSVIAETLAPGLTFQSRLVRPVLVRLREANAIASESAAEKPAAAGELALESK